MFWVDQNSNVAIEYSLGIIILTKPYLKHSYEHVKLLSYALKILLYTERNKFIFIVFKWLRFYLWKNIPRLLIACNSFKIGKCVYIKLE